MGRIIADKMEAQGGAQGTCAGASESDSLASELADLLVSESLTRSASGPASFSPATSYSPPFAALQAHALDAGLSPLDSRRHRVAIGLPNGEVFW